MEPSAIAWHWERGFLSRQWCIVFCVQDGCEKGLYTFLALEEGFLGARDECRLRKLEI